jgi:hypothetical protein
VNKRVGAVTLILSGTPLANWQNVLSELPDGHSWDEEAFKTALKSFALKYCSTMARHEQKCFMKRNVGLPSDQLTSALLSQLQQFNRYLPYLPGVGNKFNPDNIREMLYNVLPGYVHTIIATADYKWFDDTKTDSEVSSYFDRLLVIGSMARGEKPKPAHQLVARKRQDSNKFKFNENKKFIPETQKKGKPKCHFCGNLGHEETQCCFKQKAGTDAQKKVKF